MLLESKTPVYAPVESKPISACAVADSISKDVILLELDDMLDAFAVIEPSKVCKSAKTVETFPSRALLYAPVESVPIDACVKSSSPCNAETSPAKDKMSPA